MRFAAAFANAPAMPMPYPPPDLLEGAALFLDFDGTLVELAETPDAIKVPSGLGSLLGRLQERLQGRVALITGRSIAGLERHLACSDLFVSGSHGAERRLPGSTAMRPPAPDTLGNALVQAGRFAEDRGLLMEEKPAGFALHYRNRPEQAEQVTQFVAGLAEATGLSVQHGKMVVELRPAGTDKGEALRAFMREPDFAGARPLFVGDDLTDEDGFRAAAQLGGGGILVGPERETAASWRLDGVAAVAGWLEAAARA